MIALLQTFSAALVSRDCSLPEVQAGTPLVLIEPFLSVSTSTVFSAGGWEPSLVAILPLAERTIGAIFFSGTLLGLKPPSKVNLMFPASAVTGPPPAALAMPA